MASPETAIKALTGDGGGSQNPSHYVGDSVRPRKKAFLKEYLVEANPKKKGHKFVHKNQYKIIQTELFLPLDYSSNIRFYRKFMYTSGARRQSARD